MDPICKNCGRVIHRESHIIKDGVAEHIPECPTTLPRDSKAWDLSDAPVASAEAEQGTPKISVTFPGCPDPGLEFMSGLATLANSYRERMSAEEFQASVQWFTRRYGGK
jgi:hypothetical protein